MLKKGEIEYLANLAKIRMSGEETDKMEADMAAIIALMDSIQDAELPSGEPELQYVGLSSLREDEHIAELDPEIIVKASPDGSGEGFSIPKLME